MGSDKIPVSGKGGSKMDGFISVVKTITYSTVDRGQLVKLRVEDQDTGNIEDVPDIRTGSCIRYRKSGGVVQKMKVLAYWRSGTTTPNPREGGNAFETR